MRCDEAHGLIQLEIDGEIHDDERAPLVAHVAECEACSRFRNTLSALGPAIQAACPVEVPQDFTASVMARIRRRNSLAERTAPWLRPLCGTALAYVVAGCAAYLFIAFALPYAYDAMPYLLDNARLAQKTVAGSYEPILVDAYVYIPPGMVAVAACVLLAGMIAWFMRDHLMSMPHPAERARR